ncbi:putative porin [Rhodopseudomonas sp. NSM]|uniref:putative porin n=1 Tax=Rhodopseudomonas sp. NSM TaxID=3457630 RepID=UPI0040357BA2
MRRSGMMGWRMAPLGVALVALIDPAAAQDKADPAGAIKLPKVSRTAPPSSNATVNLINLLVKQGVLTDEQAAALVKQADDEAYVARQAVRDAAAKAEGAEKTAATAAEATSPAGTRRVTYVPEIVKKQLRDEIRRDVMAKAEQENWASPGKYPEWAQRIRFYGDVRVRHESVFHPSGNYPYTVNYNAINTGNPYNVLGDGSYANDYFWPTYNVDQDRQRQRLRARLGMEADLFDGFYAGMRIATGESNAPVSFNQTLGGSGGNFSKYSIWLDRAFIRYSPWSDIALSAGRFDNPFFAATDLVFHRDLGFDGVAAQAKYEISPGLEPFVVAGAFPIFNTGLDVGTSLDFSNKDVLPGKAPSRDKYMFGGQIGARAEFAPDVSLKFGAAYFDFTNVQGKLSSGCLVATVSDFCSTDLTRPSFAQRGNTYMALRNIIPQQEEGTLNLLPQYQYFGLASEFRELVISARLDLGQFHPVHVVIDGEYVRNLAWDATDIAAKVAANPLPAGAIAGCASTENCTQVYAGGNQGWLGRLTVGHREVRQLWDWSAFVGYKYLESDAVLDAFADSDFGLGGTNLKGYFVGGSLGLGPNVWSTARWLSANQVAGAPYAVDIFQLDLNARF